MLSLRPFTRALRSQTLYPLTITNYSIQKFANDSKNRPENIPVPPHPTVSESFGTKVDVEDLKKFLNPTGFLNEKDFKQYEGLDKKGNVIDNTKAESTSSESKNSSEPNTQQNKDLPPEYGFKVKGPEPTRYGDWERKGKCVDF